MFNELWQQANSEAPNRAASLITGLMLVEPQIRVSHGLSYIEAPRSKRPAIVQQDDIDGMAGATRLRCDSLEGPNNPSRRIDPLRS